jgi:membrane protein required for colicin V production
MNTVDLVLVIVLAVFALRGYWRGFFRESFGLLALFGGVAVALRLASVGAAWLEPYGGPLVVREGVAFVLTFVVTHASINLVGFLLDQMAGAASVGGLNRAAGVAVGAGKGGALAAFVLLFLHLFPLAPTLDARLKESRLAPPFVQIAGSVIRSALAAGWQAQDPART